jgi:hypothetical protein
LAIHDLAELVFNPRVLSGINPPAQSGEISRSLTRGLAAMKSRLTAQRRRRDISRAMAAPVPLINEPDSRQCHESAEEQ